MIGNHKKNEKPCSNEHTWWGKRKNGFTLAELLIVVAIIAVLVAISIPIFTNQLEKAREAVDMENIRSAYSTMKYAEALEEGPDGKKIPLSDNLYFYYLRNDGTFQKTSTGSIGNDAYAMKSHHADISEWVDNYLPDQKDKHIQLVIRREDGDLLYGLFCW